MILSARNDSQRTRFRHPTRLSQLGSLIVMTVTVGSGLPVAGAEPLPEGHVGIASRYVDDDGIARDPAVLFVENFEGYGSVSNLWSKWDNVFHEEHIRIATESANVFAGQRALEFTVPQQSAELSNALSKWISDQDVLYLRFYAKYSRGFNTLGSSHNGGMISARYFVKGQAPTPGVPATGTNYFLASYEAGREEPSVPNPGHLNTYVYHPEQRDVWGDHFYPTGEVFPFSYLPGNFGPEFIARPNVAPSLERWQTYEFMVKANRPGQRDGRIACWIDGKLIADFGHLRLRDVDRVRIDYFSIDLHIKSNTAGEAKKWYDNVVVATSYIGPIATGSSTLNIPAAPTNLQVQ